MLLILRYYYSTHFRICQDHFALIYILFTKEYIMTELTLLSQALIPSKAEIERGANELLSLNDILSEKKSGAHRSRSPRYRRDPNYLASPEFPHRDRHRRGRKNTQKILRLGLHHKAESPRADKLSLRNLLLCQNRNPRLDKRRRACRNPVRKIRKRMRRFDRAPRR